MTDTTFRLASRGPLRSGPLRAGPLRVGRFAPGRFALARPALARWALGTVLDARVIGPLRASTIEEDHDVGR